MFILFQIIFVYFCFIFSFTKYTIYIFYILNYVYSCHWSVDFLMLFFLNSFNLFSVVCTIPIKKILNYLYPTSIILTNIHLLEYQINRTRKTNGKLFNVTSNESTVLFSTCCHFQPVYLFHEDLDVLSP